MAPSAAAAAAPLLQDVPWGVVLAAVVVVWLTWRLNVVGSFYPYAYDKMCVWGQIAAAPAPLVAVAESATKPGPPPPGSHPQPLMSNHHRQYNTHTQTHTHTGASGSRARATRGPSASCGRSASGARATPGGSSPESCSRSTGRSWPSASFVSVVFWLRTGGGLWVGSDGSGSGRAVGAGWFAIIHDPCVGGVDGCPPDCCWSGHLTHPPSIPPPSPPHTHYSLLLAAGGGPRVRAADRGGPR
jgi:hypothetical protein